MGYITNRKVFISLAAVIALLVGTELSAFDRNAYRELLKKYVHTGKSIDTIKVTAVDYRSLHRDLNKPGSAFSRVLKSLERFNPALLKNRDERIAFWINVYNIGAIKLILDNYPVDSIRSMKIHIFKNPWNKKIITINGKKLSLGYIEHGILLGRYKYKAAHFGIVCASVSCPDLVPVVYRADNYRLLLRKQGQKLFQNRGKGLRIDRKSGVVYISKIFKWDTKSFPRGRKDIIPFVLPYIKNEADRKYLEKGKYSLKFLPYNWKLNEL